MSDESLWSVLAEGSSLTCGLIGQLGEDSKMVSRRLMDVEGE